MREYQRVPYNEALYVKIAKILSQDSDLVARYRAALARLPKDIEWEDLDHNDEAVAAADKIIGEINQTIRELEPGISNGDRGLSFAYFVDWVLGGRKLD